MLIYMWKKNPCMSISQDFNPPEVQQSVKMLKFTHWITLLFPYSTLLMSTWLIFEHIFRKVKMLQENLIMS